jgi:hypothetical protein
MYLEVLEGCNMNISQLHKIGSLDANTSQPTVVRRGNLSVLAMAEFRGGQMVSTPITRQRYVWPNPYNQNNMATMSRKVFAR